MKKQMLRLAYDADDAGKRVGRAIIANNEKELHNVSAKIDLGHELVNEWVADHGGKRISGGGDEGSFMLPYESAKKVEELRKKYYIATGFTISVGIGKNLSECGLSLICAKFKGKNQTIWYGSEVEKAIKESNERVKSGKASSEEIKLAEAYLEKSEYMLCNLHKNKVCDLHKSEENRHNPQDHSGSKDPCPYCADNEDLRTDDCQMCQDLDAQENADGTAGMDGCPACQEYDAANQTASGVGDCPYCQQENITEEQAKPDQHSCNCPNCPNSQGGDAQVDTTNSDHPDDCPECNELYSQAVENQPGQTGQEDPNLQGHETAEQVLNLLDKEPGSEAAQAAKKIDNTEMPQGDQMKDGTSVKDNFGQAQRNDVPDSDKTIAQSGQESGQSVQIEDQPDMSQVLQSGLDDHANEQKKQQVLDMVGQTLAGFKANKASLEATKEQNQPLYNSCIQMLKSMIELCKLLGLQPPMTAPQDPATVAESTQSDGPVAPKAAAPSEGAAQDPKTQG